MNKKSNNYLESIPKEVVDTALEMAEMATSLEWLAVDISQMTPKSILVDADGAYSLKFTSLKAVFNGLGEAIRDHKAAVKKLETFF